MTIMDHYTGVIVGRTLCGTGVFVRYGCLRGNKLGRYAQAQWLVGYLHIFIMGDSSPKVVGAVDDAASSCHAPKAFQVGRKLTHCTREEETTTGLSTTQQKQMISHELPEEDQRVDGNAAYMKSKAHAARPVCLSGSRAKGSRTMYRMRYF